MPMYNLIEYSDIYQKTLGSLWQYCRDKPALYNTNNVIDFSADKNNSISFKIKQEIKAQTGNGGIEYVKIMVPIKYLSNFWRTLEMPLINCEINLQLKQSKNLFLVAGTAVNQVAKFTITDTKLYVSVITLSTQDNVKLLKQLESGFRRIIIWNKYLFKKKQIKHKTDIQIF